jgi:accessory gene regulator protein AgrB
MGIVILILFGTIMAALAARKGYNPALWFLTGGVLGLLVLAFLPFVNEKSNLPEAERAEKKKTGDIIGGVISGLAVLITLISLAMR